MYIKNIIVKLCPVNHITGNHITGLIDKLMLYQANCITIINIIILFQ
jgi:hypothetical protein